jgi:phage tail-like protein
MKDVNGSSFHLLAEPTDWTVNQAMSRAGGAWTLAGQQNWRLPPTKTATAAKAALAASRPQVADAFGATAAIAVNGLSIQSPDGASSVALTDLNGTALAPKIGQFVAMALGGARLALLATDKTTSFLQLFDLRGRWGIDTLENPALPVSLDASGTAVAVAPDGPIFVLVTGGLAIFEGGPIDEFVALQRTRFAPVAANPNPLRRTALLTNRPGGAALAMAADATRVVILSDQGAEPQTLAVLDRPSGTWTTAPVTLTPAVPGGPTLPYMTDVALLPDGLIALMAPAANPAAPLDCAVVTLVPTQGVSLAANRYPMLNQGAPRFAATAGLQVQYLFQAGPPTALPQPRLLLPLPYPAYLTTGVLARFGLAAGDPDQVWHRLYAEADFPPGTALTVWARAAEVPAVAADSNSDSAGDRAAKISDRATMIAAIQQAQPGTVVIDAAALAGIVAASAGAIPAPSAALVASLAAAPFHLQPPLAAVPLASELPFHPGLAALAGAPGGLHELLLQRTGGANRRLTGGFLDLIAVATGNGRHSPCLRALRVYTPRFAYQDQYLPALFHQTAMSDETDQSAPASPPDFRERLFASLEGMLTPIENRVAVAEYMLDPQAAPAAMLPWLASYLGRALDPGWPEVRQRRAVAMAGRQLRQRGTYRGVCLALDIATDGAVARGEVVVLETHRLRRTNATILGIPMSGLNVLTGGGVMSGNSIVGDTLVLSAQRAIDVLALLAPSAAQGADAATVAAFLDEYADRVQVAALLQGPNAASLRAAVDAVLKAELPAQLAYEIVVTDRRFILGLSPLLDVDTFLDPPVPPAPLTLNQSVVGRDAMVRDPAALRQ